MKPETSIYFIDLSTADVSSPVHLLFDFERSFVVLT
jgi:hypothetical protein